MKNPRSVFIPAAAMCLLFSGCRIDPNAAAPAAVNARPASAERPPPARPPPAADVLFVALDTETTGLRTRTDRIVEIAAVKFKGAAFLEARSWLVNPGIPIPESATKVHGITDAMVADSPPFRDVFPQLVAFLQEAPILAHNAPFDASILRAEIRRNDLPPPRIEIIDTLPLFRRWFPDSPDHKLETLVRHLKLPEPAFHRALGDAHSAARLFWLGLQRLPDVTVSDLLTPSSRVHTLYPVHGK